MSIPNYYFEPSRSYDEALEKASLQYGIEREYIDTWGKRHCTPPQVKQGILKALGIQADSQEGLDKALEDRLWQEWSAPLPPVVVLSEVAWPRELALHVPMPCAEGQLTVRYLWEKAPTLERHHAAAQLRTTGKADLRGQSFLRKQLPLPEDAPLGYHRVEICLETPGQNRIEAHTRLIVCPEHPYMPPELANHARTAGLALSLYGLRSARNWGCGDLTDLDALTTWLAERVGVSFIGLNPLHALANRQPYNISPYLPVSVLYQNILYLDVERVPEFEESPPAREWLSAPGVQSELNALRSSELVEYERVFALKLQALRLAFDGFLEHYRAADRRAEEFKSFAQNEGEALERFAVYCALDEWMHAQNPEVWVWPQWPSEYRDPDSEATRRFAQEHWRDVLFYQYAQWRLNGQLAAAQQQARSRGLAIGLYHDFALATDRCGADLWAYRDFYVAGCRVGAPPDNFSPLGQDWSFPPPNAVRHRQDGYRLFAEWIRKNCRHGGALRFDHVMRFFRLYWIPEGMTPSEGGYVRENHQDLLHILCLESHRNQVVLVGEDLGTITPSIREALNHTGILGYRVPYFERTQDQRPRPPRDYPERALVSSSTHDLPTWAGFWEGRDIEIRRAAGLLPDEASYHAQWGERAQEKQKFLDLLHSLGLLPEWYPRWADQAREFTGELHNAFTGMLASTPCRMLVLNQEDLFKETEQQNLPASTWQYPNWRHKWKFSLEDLVDSQTARDFTAMFRNWLARTERLPRG